MPQVNSRNPDAQRGSDGHAWLYDALNGRVTEPRHDACKDLQLSDMPWADATRGTWRGEVAFGYDVATGQVRGLGENLGRAYPERVSESEIFGSIDLVGHGLVADYKFEGFESHTPPARDNSQLAFAGLCLARLQKLDEVKVGLIRIQPDGEIVEDWATLDLFDFDVLSARLRSTLERVRIAEREVAEGKIPSVSRGPWCRYCPAASSCPAVTNLIRAVALEPVKTAEEIRAMLTPETAAKAYRRLREVEEALKPVKTALHLFADETEIDLGDGLVYGATTSDREKLDARIARKALAELHGPEVAEAACDFETSKTAIERALRPVHEAKRKADEKVSLKDLKEQAFEAVRAAGGSEIKRTRTVKEHRK
jgi:Protein of unknown function (DUF2800)